MNNKTFQLVLASASPRRKDLLEKAGFHFHVFSVKVSENLEKNLTVDEQILQIARRKAWATALSYQSTKNQPFVVLAADTMVTLGEELLGKPVDTIQAHDFLRRLSGQTHEVKTAVVMLESFAPGLKPSLSISQIENNVGDHLYAEGKISLNLKQIIETTKVTFRHLSDREIEEYIASGEPMDKAGAYGIQGAAGNFVEKINGSFDNVVGLPIEKVKKLLQKGNWKIHDV